MSGGPGHGCIGVARCAVCEWPTLGGVDREDSSDHIQLCLPLVRYSPSCIWVSTEMKETTHTRYLSMQEWKYLGNHTFIQLYENTDTSSQNVNYRRVPICHDVKLFSMVSLGLLLPQFPSNCPVAMTTVPLPRQLSHCHNIFSFSFSRHIHRILVVFLWCQSPVLFVRRSLSWYHPYTFYLFMVLSFFYKITYP